MSSSTDETTDENEGRRPVSITLTIDAHPYTFRPRELDAWTAALFLEETGVEVEAMLRSFDEGATLVTAARFVYLSALQSGQDPDSFEDVAKRLRVQSDVVISAEYDDDADDEAVANEEAAPLPPPNGSDETSDESSPVSPITSASGSRT